MELKISKILTGQPPHVFTGDAEGRTLSLRLAKKEMDRRLLLGMTIFPSDLGRGDLPHFKALRDYCARSADVITGGYSEAPIAVFGDGERTEELADLLRGLHMNADVYPISDLNDSELHPAVQGDVLRIDTRTYRMAVILEPVAGIAGFAGFDKLPLPEVVTHMGEKLAVKEFVLRRVSYDDQTDLKALAGDIASQMTKAGLYECRVTPAFPALRYYHYELSEASAYFIANQGDKEFRGRFFIDHPMRNAANAHYEKNARRLTLNTRAKASGAAYTYDPWQNMIDRADYMDGTFSLVLEPGKSIFLIIDRSISSTEEIGRALPKDYIDLFHLHVVRMEDDWSKGDQGERGGSTYSGTFTAQEGRGYFLEIADADEGVECFLNGKSVGCQILPAFWFDLRRGIKPGINQLIVEVVSSSGGTGSIKGGIKVIEIGK